MTHSLKKQRQNFEKQKKEFENDTLKKLESLLSQFVNEFLDKTEDKIEEKEKKHVEENEGWIIDSLFYSLINY